MDSNNVISITNRLEALQEDFRNWNNMSSINKEKSDKICKETYNLTNRELYNKLNSSILLGKKLDINSSLSESFDYSAIDRKDLIMRITLAKNLNQDITVAVLYPYDPSMFQDETYRENYKREFNDIYQRYLGLTHKYKKYSNSYSLQLFGYNVYALYQLIEPDLYTQDNSNVDTTMVFSQNYLNSDISSLEESLNDILLNKNILELYKFKLCASRDLNSRVLTEGVSSDSLIFEVDRYFTHKTDDLELKTVIPYFTLSEYNSIVDSNEDSSVLESINSDRDYYNKICELYDKFSNDKSDSIAESQLLTLGWNPAVDPRKYMDKVRERQLTWFQEYGCHLIDLSNFDITSKKYRTVLESSFGMNKKYKELDLYPVYLVLSYTNTVFGKAIRIVKKSKFTHAGLSLDSNLNEILTFMFNDKNNKGFMVESLNDYIKTYKDAMISVLVFFVDSETKAKLEDSILYFTNNKHKTYYNFRNILNILRNKAKDYDPDNLSMVCSQFVDTILKLANIDLTNKPSNLVTPKDIAEIKHPRVFNMYEGLALKYDELKMESKIDYLLSNQEPEDICYIDFVNKMYESSFNLISSRYHITDNEYANTLLNKFYDYIKIN